VDDAQFVGGQLAHVSEAMDAPARALEGNHKGQLPCRLTLTPLFAPPPGVEAPLLPGALKVRESPRLPVSSGGQPRLALFQPKSSFTGEATIRVARIIDRTQSH
jgi:hypothetical protein